MEEAEARWRKGLRLTYLIIVLLVIVLSVNYGTYIVLSQNITETQELLINLRDKPIDTSGVTLKDMQEIKQKINSIERFIRTTPLVECGSYHDRGTK
jgi:hypothetical protein